MTEDQKSRVWQRIENSISDDTVIWRRDLQDMLRVSTETMRRYIKEQKLPKPDVDLSNRTKGWKASTLRQAGVNI